MSSLNRETRGTIDDDRFVSLHRIALRSSMSDAYSLVIVAYVIGGSNNRLSVVPDPIRFTHGGEELVRCGEAEVRYGAVPHSIEPNQIKSILRIR